LDAGEIIKQRAMAWFFSLAHEVGEAGVRATIDPSSVDQRAKKPGQN
jgi:hypothetical protein